MPKVSVIIPVFGVEKYIERCARSLFEQTLDDMEFIFVNDCTKDNSMAILQKVMLDYPQRLSQIKIIEHEFNRGLPFARQSGIVAARGEYIAHCDSDDWTDTDMYRLMYEKVKEEHSDMVVCDFYSASGVNSIQKKIKGMIPPYEKDEFANDLLYRRVPWSVWNKLVDKRIYQNDILYPSNAMSEDMLFTMQFVFYCRRISYLEKPLYYYYENPISITRDVSKVSVLKKITQLKENTDLLISFYEKNGCEKKYSAQISFLKYNVRNKIQAFRHHPEFKSLWKSIYPESISEVIRDRNAPLKDRIKNILISIHLF